MSLIQSSYTVNMMFPFSKKFIDFVKFTKNTCLSYEGTQNKVIKGTVRNIWGTGFGMEIIIN